MYIQYVKLKCLYSMKKFNKYISRKKLHGQQFMYACIQYIFINISRNAFPMRAWSLYQEA